MERKLWKGVIYMLESPSGKKYIGQTMRPKKRRLEFLNINQSYAGIKIDNARKKYGPENFKYSELFYCVGETQRELKENLNIMEQLNIDYFDTMCNGYNNTAGGDNVYVPDEETKRKISKANRNPSEETRRKNSEAHKGKIPWNKGKKGVQKGWNKGLHRSEETKRKISEKLKGNIPWNKGIHKNNNIIREVSLW